MTLLEELQPELASFLSRRGFRILEERRGDAFNNAKVVVECEGFLLRVVRDRGDTIIAFCQQGKDRWHLGENVLEFLTGITAADFSKALQANFDLVSDLMKSDLDQRGYTDFEKKKAKMNIQRLFRQRET